VGTLFLMQSPSEVINSSVLSPGKEKLRTGSPIALLASHCELDDKVAVSPSGGTQIVRGLPAYPPLQH